MAARTPLRGEEEEKKEYYGLPSIRVVRMKFPPVKAPLKSIEAAVQMSDSRRSGKTAVCVIVAQPAFVYLAPWRD